MEQQIRFCTTSDGVRIAYATVGEGPPLVKAANWLTHLEYDWKSPIWRHILDGLSHHQLLVRYDERGTGLSDRKIDEMSLDHWVADLEAVVDALKLERFPLLGISQGGPVAVAYALRHPQRVSHLVLYGTYAQFPQPMETEEQRQFFESLVTLVRLGWGQHNPAYRQIFTTMFVPGATAEQMRWFNELEHASTSPENAARILETFATLDVRDLALQLQMPTLVLHRRGDQACPFHAGQELASLIPNARFVPLPGNNHLFLEGEEEVQEFFAAIADFLGWPGTPPQAKAVPAGPVQAPLTILFTDMESSTALTQRLGDAKAQEILRTHNAIVREALKACSGSEIKHTGDGIMASFAAASKAIECAVAIQRAVAAQTEDEPNLPLGVHIGLNAGEPVAEDEDLFGTAVQLARRACDHAEAGEILASNVVRELVAGKGFLFADRGDTALRGFEDPVHLYEVRWRQEE